MGTRYKLKKEDGDYLLTEDGEYIILESVPRGRRNRYNFWQRYRFFYGTRRQEKIRRRKK